jgi:hypothetical protein
MFMIGKSIVVLVLLGGGYSVFKWMKKTEKSVTNEFQQSIQYSVAHWLASKLDTSELQIRSSLEQWIDQNAQPSLLTSVIRVECEVTRGAKECLVKITVALEENSGVTIGEVEQKVSWESLPRDIREEFIRSGEPKQAFEVVKR